MDVRCNDFFSSRSGVPTDIMLFGLSTFTKELRFLSLNVISHYEGSSRIAWISVGAVSVGGSAVQLAR